MDANLKLQDRLNEVNKARAAYMALGPDTSTEEQRDKAWAVFILQERILSEMYLNAYRNQQQLD